MALNCKNCKVCGKEYKACNPLGLKSDKFRWQTVACSPECGAIYLERYLASKSEKPKQSNVLESEEPKVIDLYIPELDDKDEFEDDLDSDFEFDLE